MYDVKIDISENARFIEKPSVIGVATDDGIYKKNRVLLPKVKRRITNYSSYVVQIHAIMIYKLIKNELQNYSSVQICCDVGKNKLKNALRKLLSNNKDWQRLDSTKKIKIRAVGNSFVDQYVRSIRKNGIRKSNQLSLNTMNDILKEFIKKNKSRHKK